MNYRYRNEEEMKDSCVEWVEKIPRDWIVSKLKYEGRVVGRIGFKGYTKEDLVDKDEGALTLGAKHIQNNSICLHAPEYISWNKYYESPEIMVKEKDLLVTQRGSIGKVAIIEDDIGYATINPSVVLIKDVRCYSKYLYYILIADYTQKIFDSYVSSTAVPMISQEQLNNIQVLIPKLKEQIKIIRFLDEKIAQFDSIISKKEALIQKLEEAKKSLISEVVTGKVKVVKTTDGYELVDRKKEEMKDSGIELFNKIPLDWKYSKLKYLTNQIIDGSHTTPNYIDSGIPFLRVTDITNNSEKIDKDNVKYISMEEHNELIKRCKPEKGDLLVSKNGTIGVTKVIDWEWEFSIFVSLCLIKVKKELSVNLLSLYFKSNILDEQIAYGGKKTSITNLHLEKIREFVVPIPSLIEQEKIIDYLNKECIKIDSVINKILLQIEKLKEAKQSLISEAVTGKIEILE